MSAPLHANLLARLQDGRWRGVLLRGPSGAGKSELTLRLLGRGWRLAADDRVIVWASGGRLWGRAPDVLWGLMEVRGVGVLPFPALAYAQIAAVVDCTPGADLERIPSPATVRLCGLDIPACRLDATAPSAPEKLAAFCDARRL